MQPPNGQSEAVRWINGGSQFQVERIGVPPGYDSGYAQGISGDGTLVLVDGYIFRTDQQEVFLWSPNSGWKPLGYVVDPTAGK
jgi:hypothetical protein